MRHVKIRDGRLMIIGDPHASPRYDNKRFRLLGQEAKAHRVTHVLCTGDWPDYESLLDHGSPLSMQGKRVRADTEAANDALCEFDGGLAGHEVHKEITLGNHCMRPNRRAEKYPELEGTMDWADVRYHEHGWNTTPWKEDVRIGPFVCSHHRTSKMGKAVDSKYLAARITGAFPGTGSSSIVGHAHRFDHWVESYPDRKDHGIVAGCMVHPRMRNEGWCRHTSHEWDIGVTYVDIRGGRVQTVHWEYWEL